MDISGGTPPAPGIHIVSQPPEYTLGPPISQAMGVMAITHNPHNPLSATSDSSLPHSTIAPLLLLLP